MIAINAAAALIAAGTSLLNVSQKLTGYWYRCFFCQFYIFLFIFRSTASEGPRLHASAG
jgi:hypothetical protein